MKTLRHSQRKKKPKQIIIIRLKDSDRDEYTGSGNGKPDGNDGFRRINNQEKKRWCSDKNLLSHESAWH